MVVAGTAQPTRGKTFFDDCMCAWAVRFGFEPISALRSTASHTKKIKIEGLRVRMFRGRGGGKNKSKNLPSHAHKTFEKNKLIMRTSVGTLTTKFNFFIKNLCFPLVFQTFTSKLHQTATSKLFRNHGFAKDFL